MNEKNRKEFANLLIELSDDCSIDFASAKEYLQADGVNVDDLVKRGLAQIQKLKGKQELEQAKKRVQLLEDAKVLLAELKGKQKEADAKNNAMRLFVNNPSSGIQLFFNKIKDLNEDDALGMLDNATLLELIDQLEKSNEDDSSAD